jgi:hypothetical protein
MVLSTANIYFTAHDDGGARVFRTAQSATPGQETELCYEPDCRFGDIVYADVDGVFYGYFFALASGMTTIRRIPLAPQPGQVAEIIGPTPPVADIDVVSSHGNLVTDGSFLYWQSDTAINKMPIRGGTVTNLDTTPLTRPVTGLHLVGPNLIYAVDRIVYYVPADGSAVTIPAERVVFTAEAGVVACASQAGPFPAVNFTSVADRNGGIVSHSANGTSVIQSPGAAFITSMANADQWTQMATAQLASGEVEAAWQLRINAGASAYTFTIGANPRLALASASGVYWLDDDGVVTYAL